MNRVGKRLCDNLHDRDEAPRSRIAEVAVRELDKVIVELDVDWVAVVELLRELGDQVGVQGRLAAEQGLNRISWDAVRQYERNQ